MIVSCARLNKNINPGVGYTKSVHNKILFVLNLHLLG